MAIAAPLAAPSCHSVNQPPSQDASVLAFLPRERPKPGQDGPARRVVIFPVAGVGAEPSRAQPSRAAPRDFTWPNLHPRLSLAIQHFK